ncbi:MAG: 1-acyl-sn-glycerol-3-phosphate acyltransferase [Gemmataceae bacterium]|nr:1-acyl-sn-glycerol-3-phosphate acyltransferase [Gemmataceae bacterium]
MKVPEPATDNSGTPAGAAADGVITSLAADLWFHFCRVVSAHVYVLGFSLRVEGGNNLPRSGPVLAIANHQSFLDPVAIGLASPRRLIYLARKTLFRNWFFSWLIRSLNAVPIDQEGIGIDGLRTVRDQLALGKAVLVFPEGERTPTGSMVPLKPGIHLLMRKTRMAIVPVGIAGAYHAWPRWRSYPLPAPVFCPPRPGAMAVSIGKPLDSQRWANAPREQVLTELFAAIANQQRRAEKLRRYKGPCP